MLDYHGLRESLKSRLIAYWQSATIGQDPLAWAWIFHAWADRGIPGHPLLNQALSIREQWIQEAMAQGEDSSLAALSILVAASNLAGHPLDSRTNDYLFLNIGQLLDHDRPGKFAVLNDPNKVLPIALALGDPCFQLLRQRVLSICAERMATGVARRQMLFASAASELGGTALHISLEPRELAIHDLPLAAWTVERYPNLQFGPFNAEDIWLQLEQLLAGIEIHPGSQPDASLYTLSIIDTVMLYEALEVLLSKGDFLTLFRNIPIHPKVRTASEQEFLSQNYANAVFQACLVFVAEVKHRAGNPTNSKGKLLDGTALIEHVFLATPPLLKFNAYSTHSEQDEQVGLGNIAKGVVMGFRNPAGHVPHARLVTSAEEALERLTVVSYLMKRLDRSTP